MRTQEDGTGHYDLLFELEVFVLNTGLIFLLRSEYQCREVRVRWADLYTLDRLAALLGRQEPGVGRRVREKEP